MQNYLGYRRLVISEETIVKLLHCQIAMRLKSQFYWVNLPFRHLFLFKTKCQTLLTHHQFLTPTPIFPNHFHPIQARLQITHIQNHLLLQW